MTLSLAHGGLNQAVEEAFAPNTRRMYANHWRKWVAWARERGVPELGPEPGHVVEYLEHMIGLGYGFSTVDGFRSAMTWAHRVLDLPSPFDNKRLCFVFRAACRRLKSAKPRKQAKPMSVDDVRRLADHAEAKGDHAFRLSLLVQFSGALRVSEVFLLQVQDVAFEPQGMVLSIRGGKTGDRTVPVRYAQETRYCAVRAVRARIIDAGLDLTDWLMANRRPGYLKWLRIYLAELGIESSSHGLRAGYVTTALERGADYLQVARVTGHKSMQMLATYDRRDKWKKTAESPI